MSTPTVDPLSLDDLYVMTAHMYSHRNEERPVAATFAHFVEVCAALTAHTREKHRESLDIPGALCKALGWFFPLMAKLRVRSIADLVYRKYPYACPYCRRLPHVDMECKLVRGADTTVDHDALRSLYIDNAAKRPSDLDDWRKMFSEIYPRSLQDRSMGRSAVGLFEELGELAEAVRVFERYPKYLAGEAADVFSYLMAIATEFAMSEEVAGRPGFSLQHEYLERYPGLCTQCGYHVCVCPPVPASTVGRTAKELDVRQEETLFDLRVDALPERAAKVADRVVTALGGYKQLLDPQGTFPFDRGEANRNLVMLLMRVADSLQDLDPSSGDSLRSAAFRVASNEAPAGSPDHDKVIAAALAEFRQTPGAIGAAEQGPPLAFEPTDGGRLSPPRWRVLVATAGPEDQLPLRLRQEARGITEAVRRSEHRDSITVHEMHATTMTALRRALLEADYDLVHLSGHGDVEGPLLEDDDGNAVVLTIGVLTDLLKMSATAVRCVVLNCCYAAGSVTEPLAQWTVGMDDQVQDDVAIQFALGFFDALGAGKDIDRCIREGRMAARMATGGDEPPIVILTDSVAAAGAEEANVD